MTDNSFSLSKKLLDWYKIYGRDLPWRVKGRAHPYPYEVLVSEFMLQQTTVKTVIPYFKRFMQRFPTLQTLSEASIDDVLQYWQGLGYYSRARALHDTAKMIAQLGYFPNTREEVLKLKGIGHYTASSFLALAFNLPETVIDGNVMRIICRLNHWNAPLNEIQPQIQQYAEKLTDKQSPADYASAIMDLGAVVCTPKNPQCLICPWQNDCLSYGAADVEQIPIRPKVSKLEKDGYVYLIINSKKQIYIRKRYEKGLLSGLYEFPWSGEQLNLKKSQPLPATVTHVFTHIKFTLQLYICHTDKYEADGFFADIDKLNDYPMSTLMKKVHHQAVVSCL